MYCFSIVQLLLSALADTPLSPLKYEIERMLSIQNTSPLAAIVTTPRNTHNKMAFQMKSDVLEHCRLFSCTSPPA